MAIEQVVISPRAKLEVQRVLAQSKRQYQQTLTRQRAAEQQEILSKKISRRKRRFKGICKLIRVRRREARIGAGIENLVALGNSPEVQALVASKLRNVRPDASDHVYSRACPIFYSADRPAGNAWEGLRGGQYYMVEIRFLEDGVQLTTIWGTDGESNLELLFSSTPEDRLDQVCSFQTDGVADFDGNARLALNRRQRKWEWWPPQLLHQVLADCAEPEKLQRYFLEMLKSSHMQ